MRESRYDFLCAVLLGLGQLCMFTGYDTQLTIVESVLHSVHDRSPSTIDAHAGYYGPAIAWMVFTFANLAAPWALGILGSKYALLLGSLLFTLHLASYFLIHWIPYFGTCALVGVGFALFYTGHAAYTTEHSTKTTIERNSAMTWGLATTCMTVGGITLLFTTKPVDHVSGTFNTTTDIRSYRVYSNSEIRIMYGAFLAATVVSNIIFALIPTREVKSSISNVSESKNNMGFGEPMWKTVDTMREKYMLQLVPLFGYIGMAGVGFVIGFVSKHVRNFSMTPTLIIGCASFSMAMVLVLLSTPNWASVMPTDEATLLIEPNAYLPLLIALLFGIGDNCVNTSRTVICALIMPEKRAQVFSISKFHQSLLGSLICFLSPFMSMRVHFVLMMIWGTATLILYRCVVNDVDAQEILAVENETGNP